MPKKKPDATPPTETPALEAGRVVFLPVDALLRDETQPRIDFNAEALQDLADNILARGVKHPIVVRSDYVIEDGERRWRAAKLVGLITVPCILAADADEQSPALERALDQVAQNSLREPLNPMEWARFFLRMRAEFGLSVEQMSDTMTARGIKMSRPYISNLMRLAALPDWAQTKISAGELTAAHGKVLLTAQASPKVLDTLHKDIAKSAREGRAPTTEEVQGAIFDAFDHHHIRLDSAFGDDAPKFNTKQCDACEHCVPVNIRYHSSRALRFCVNKEHFAELQAEAKSKAEKRAKSGTAADEERAPRPPKQPKLNADGVFESRSPFSSRFVVLDADDFDIAVCENCEWKKPVSVAGRPPEPACFNVAEYEAKRAAGRRNQGRLERVATHFDQWVRQQTAPRLEIDKRLQFQLLTYLAIGQPGSYGQERAYRELTQAAGVRHIAAHLTLVEAGDFPADKVFIAALEHLDRGELYHFARYAGVQLTPETFRIDAAYIDLCKKADIVRLIEATELKFLDDWTTAQAGKLADLKAFALTDAAIAALGVPREITHTWESNDVNPRDYDDYEGDDVIEDDEDDNNEEGQDHADSN